MPREAKMRRCWNCGAEMGVYADYDRMDTCGSPECEGAVRDAYAEERAEAHEQLDRDMGY
jgi:hypothetical protein